MQMIDQLTSKFENEMSQWSAEAHRLRAELSKAAELMRICIGREKLLHEMLEELTGQQAPNANTGHETLSKTGLVNSGNDRLLSAGRSLGAPFVYAAPPVSTAQQPMSPRHGYGVPPRYFAQAKQLLDSVAELENEISRISFVLDTPLVDASNCAHRSCPASIVVATPAHQAVPYRTHSAHLRTSRSVSATPAGRLLHSSRPSTPHLCAAAEGQRVALPCQGMVSPSHPIPSFVPMMQPQGGIAQPPPMVRGSCPTTAMSMMAH